jgi:hypothetical protein
MENFSWVNIVEEAKKTHPQLAAVIIAAFDQKTLSRDARISRIGLVLSIIISARHPRTAGFVQDLFSIFASMSGVTQLVVISFCMFNT